MEIVMSIKQAEPSQAYNILQTNPDSVYVDVRTEEEFAQGHPEGAYNIPLLLRGAQGMRENPDFVAAVRKAFANDRKLVVGCQTGSRSRRATELLLAAGYADVVEQRAGY